MLEVVGDEGEPDVTRVVPTLPALREKREMEEHPRNEGGLPGRVAA